MWLRHFLFDEADGGDKGGSGNGGGSGGDGDQGNKGEPSEVVREMQAQMGVLTKAVTLMAQGQSEVQKQIATLVEHGKTVEPPEKKQSGTSNDLFDGVDLEQLDRKEYGTLLMTKFLERIEEHMGTALKPVRDEINNIKDTVTKDLGSRQIKDVSGSNPDLMEWRDEIATLLKETPTLSLSRALAIARSENPEKVKEMTKKYSSNGKDDGKGKQPVFLGLTPTSRTTGSDSKQGRMKFNEAAERAFDDVLASLGATDLDQVMPRR